MHLGPLTDLYGTPGMSRSLSAVVEIDFEVVSKDSDGHVSIPGSAAQKFGGSLNEHSLANLFFTAKCKYKFIIKRQL